MTGFDVDGRLPLADGAQVPGRVHQTPEGRDCGGLRQEEKEEVRRGMK